MLNKNMGMGLALLAGVGIGIGIAIIAREKGGKRKKMKDSLSDMKSELKDAYDSVKDKASKIDIEGTYENLVSNLSSKSEDVVSFLENKLSSLKKEMAKH